MRVSVPACLAFGAGPVCVRRYGAGNLNALKPAMPQEPHKAFKSYEPGFVHMDVKYLPQMQEETKRRYLFVTIDWATR